MRRLTPLLPACLLALVFAASAHATTVPVTVDNNFYSPTPATAKLNDQVLWTWAVGAFSHSVTSDAGSAETFGSTIKTTGNFSHTFNRPGSFTYHCAVHGSGMAGTVNVAGITGRVFADADASNTVTAADDGLGGITVRVYDALDYSSNPMAATPMDSTTTDSNGRYVFSNPMPALGFATVVVDPQPGFGSTPAKTDDFASGANTVSENKDILLKGAGSISGTVWNDVNGNGAHDGPESGKQSISVSLNGGERTTTTASDGTYTFANAIPGTFPLAISVPSGFSATGPTSQGVTLDVGNTFVATGKDFFVREALASISGVVHDDVDGSSSTTPGDGLLANVTMGLDTSGDGVADTTTTTGADGAYAFTSLPARAYRVIFNVPSGYMNTGPIAIDATLPAGANATGQDFFARIPPPAPPAQQPAAETPPDDGGPETTIELLGSGQGTPGDDLLNGTDGADKIFGLGGDDLLLGLGGNDLLDGGEGNDSLDGGSGNDSLKGGNGKDSLTGGPGNDKLSGGAGSDKLSGGAGKDTLDGGKGKDGYNAGPGDDTVNSKDGTAEIVNCGAGKDKVRADKKDKLKSCEKRS